MNIDNMKLSDLVGFRTELDQLSVLPACSTAMLDVGKVVHLASSFPTGQPHCDTLVQSQLDIVSQFNKFEEQINVLKAEVQSKIEELERPYFQESYRLYEHEEMQYMTNEQILDRTIGLQESELSMFMSRLSLYNSWKYPGMIIRPGRESFIDNMVMFDPLYLIDQNQELLQPAMDKFSELYQRRLRPYYIQELSDEPILKQIPDNQFGVCLAFNYFNFRPLEVIKRYLHEVFAKLRNGGVFILTFNDCDRQAAVALVEHHYCSYTPSRLITNLAESIGYEIAFKWNADSPSTWLELKKPGAITSIRGGQTMSRIMSL